MKTRLSRKGATHTVTAITLAALAAYAYGCSSSGSSSTDATSNGNGSEISLYGTGTVDNAAVVEVTTMMLASGLNSTLDQYNREDPFSISSAPYSSTFAQRLALFDAEDGTTDWSADQSQAWTSRISSGNYLVVDTSKPCDFDDPATYLEIERAAFTGVDHQTCGGRMPNEDAFDVTINYLVRGPAASVNDDAALHDGVDQATQQSSDTFPYLADLN